MKYYLEMVEGLYRFSVGDDKGYNTLEEAQEEAKKRVDDALPHNYVYIYQRVGYAYFGGDGESYIKMFDKDSVLN